MKRISVHFLSIGDSGHKDILAIGQRAILSIGDSGHKDILAIGQRAILSIGDSGHTVRKGTAARIKSILMKLDLYVALQAYK
jgi:dihydroxyacetone kinase